MLVGSMFLQPVHEEMERLVQRHLKGIGINTASKARESVGTYAGPLVVERNVALQIWH